MKTLILNKKSLMTRLLSPVVMLLFLSTFVLGDAWAVVSDASSSE